MGCDQVIVHIEHTLGFLPRCVFCRLSVFLSSFDCPLVASLKSTSCLSKFAQTWREKPAKHSDLAHFSGKSFRLGEKIRLHGSAHEPHLDPKVTSRKARLKSAKNLCFGYRFFAEIRQIHRFFGVIRQKLQNLCRSQARLVQALQVGCCSQREELLVMCSGLLAAHRSLKTTVSPAIFEQHLNKNFY